MSTLPNVNTRGDGAASPGAGLTPDSIPKADCSQTGVSVKYAPDPTKNWYVLRATYGRAEQVYRYITQDGLDTEAYLAMHFVKKQKKGLKKRVLSPLIPNILFVYGTEEQVWTYVNDTPAISFLRFYYNHLVKNPDKTNPPLIIDYEQMMNFIKATSVDSDDIMLIDEQFVNYKSGDTVRVIDGKFAGVTGRVARAAGQQRLIIKLEGVALIATAYIPAAFLEKVDTPTA